MGISILMESIICLARSVHTKSKLSVESTSKLADQQKSQMERVTITPKRYLLRRRPVIKGLRSRKSVSPTRRSLPPNARLGETCTASNSSALARIAISTDTVFKPQSTPAAPLPIILEASVHHTFGSSATWGTFLVPHTCTPPFGRLCVVGQRKGGGIPRLESAPQKKSGRKRSEARFWSESNRMKFLLAARGREGGSGCGMGAVRRSVAGLRGACLLVVVTGWGR